MVTVPARGLPGFADTVTFTDPDPVVEPPGTVINDALLVAFHTHVGAAVTATVTTDSQSPIGVSVGGERLVGHDAVDDCVTKTVCPAIVSVPARVIPAGLAGAVTVTKPLPLPEAVAIVRKLALL